MSDAEGPDWVLAAFDLLAAWNGRSLEWHRWAVYDARDSLETGVMLYSAAGWVLSESDDPGDIIVAAHGVAWLIQFLLSSPHLSPSSNLVIDLCESLGESLVVRAQKVKLALDELVSAVEVCPPLADSVRIVW